MHALRLRRSNLHLVRALGAAALITSLGACAGDDSGSSATDSDTGTETTTGDTETTGAAAPFGSDEDVVMATELWTEMDGYLDGWAAYPGKEGFAQGLSPHGAWQQLRLNGVGAMDPANPVDGYILVKANYLEMSDTSLDSVTVMKKVAGYNPDEADWFWAKYDPDGTLQENGEGVKLAGAIGKGGDAGCIPCHASAGGDDFLFIND